MASEIALDGAPMKLSCLLLLLSSLIAHADSIPYAGPNYVVHLLDSDEGRAAVGFDGSGRVVLANDIYADGTCSSYPYNQNCYHTYSDGHLAAVSAVNPNIGNDFGLSCGVGCVTNNGLTVSVSGGNLITPKGVVVLGQGWGDFLFLNGEGDILWNDPRSENWFEAIDPPAAVPEPATWLLVGIGTLLIARFQPRVCESPQIG